MKRKRYSHWLGFLGFLGFKGFEYFSSHNIIYLGYFALFGMFAYFWIGKVANDMADERYLENSRKAKSVAFDIAIIEFIILNFITIFEFGNKEILTLAYTLCFAILIISYAIAFYRFERI